MGYPAVIAHRGYAGVAPENTVDAATRAVSDDETAMLEIDVQPAACGTPVVIHDERLDGSRDGRPLTDATGLVRETPLEKLRETHVLGTDATVPTLAEFLAAVLERVGVNVELKEHGLAADAADALAAHEGPVLVSAFDAGVLAEVRVAADLALVTPTAVECLVDAAADADVAIAPGRGGGTNALVVSHPDFRVDFHGVSYRDHRRIAREVGASVAVVDSMRLATDVDVPADLAEVLLHGDGEAAVWLSEAGFELDAGDGRVGVSHPTADDTE